MDNLDGLKQTWNPRSKKWVLINDAQKGGIKGMSSTKYEGVPVINDKPGGENGNQYQNTKEPGKDDTKQEQAEPETPVDRTGETVDDNEDNSDGFGFW